MPAVLRLPALPDPVTSRTLATVLAKRQTGGSIMIGEKDAIGMAKLGARDWVALLSINLFDSIWIRYLGSRHEHFSMYSVHPELSRVSDRITMPPIVITKQSLFTIRPRNEHRPNW